MVEKINNLMLKIIGLYRENYFNHVHIRRMAQILEKSHVSLLPHLHFLEEKNILLTKSVGKSKIYFLNLKNFLTAEYLSMGEKKRLFEFVEKNLFIKKVCEEFFINLSSGCLVLFGSYAEEKQKKDSDMDVLFIGKEDKKKISEIINGAALYGKKIHLVSLTAEKFKEALEKENALAKEIVKNHIVLYNSDLFVHFLWGHFNGKKK